MSKETLNYQEDAFENIKTNYDCDEISEFGPFFQDFRNSFCNSKITREEVLILLKNTLNYLYGLSEKIADEEDDDNTHNHFMNINMLEGLYEEYDGVFHDWERKKERLRFDLIFFSEKPYKFCKYERKWVI